MIDKMLQESLMNYMRISIVKHSKMRILASLGKLANLLQYLWSSMVAHEKRAG